MRCLGLNVMIVLCPSVIVVYISKWKSFKEIKTRYFCFNFHVLNFEDAIEFDYNGTHLTCWYMNEVMLGCFQCCLGGVWDGYELGNPLKLQPNRITNQGDVNKPSIIVYPCLKLRVKMCELSMLRNAFYEESDSMKPHENPQTTEYMRTRQFVITLLVYVLSLFEWLIMVPIGVGDLILLRRNAECDIVCWMCGGVTSDFVLSHSDENEHTVTNFRNFVVSKILISATALHNHILLVFKWLIMMSNGKGMSVGSFFLSCMSKGREHEITTMHEQLLGNNKSGCERVKQGSILIAREGLFRNCQGVFRESLRKWSLFADSEIRTSKEESGVVYDCGDLRILSPRIVILIATFNKTFNHTGRINEKSLNGCFIEESNGVTLQQVFNVQDKRKPQCVGVRLKCKGVSLLHTKRINCKMRATQFYSSKIEGEQRKLSSKAKGLSIADSKRAKQLLLLQWSVKMKTMVELKIAWRKNINTKTGSMRANYVNTIKSVIEWMIAWWSKSMLRGRLSKNQR